MLDSEMRRASRHFGGRPTTTLYRRKTHPWQVTLLLAGVVAGVVLPLRSGLFSALAGAPSQHGIGCSTSSHRHGSRHQPRVVSVRAAEAADEKSSPEDVWVGKKTETLNLAKYIGDRLRKENSTLVKSQGLECGYTAITAGIFVARDNPNKRLVMIPTTLTTENVSGTAPRVELHTTFKFVKVGAVKSEGEPIYIGKSTNAGKAAGLMKRRMLENGEAKIYAIGPEPVKQAVAATMLAAKFLEQDGMTNVEIGLTPHYEEVERETGNQTCVVLLSRYYLDLKLQCHLDERQPDLCSAPFSHLIWI